MFDETEKYKNCGHFFLNKGEKLAIQSKDVPQLAGVYYIYRLAKGRVDLVYIGKSGTVQQNGTFKNQTLKERINNKQDGVKRQVFFDEKMESEHIDALDIYWFVTMNENNKDLPSYVEGLLMQHYFDIYGRLPPWNKEF
jgi:hypothetical protein